MRFIPLVLTTLLLSACGGGGEAPATESLPPAPPPISVVSDEQYCEDFTLFREIKYSDGSNELTTVEENSEQCGYVPPPEYGTPLSDPYCSKQTIQDRFITLLTLVRDIADGTGGKQVEIVEETSIQCGYAQDCPTSASGEAGDFPYITCDGVRQSTNVDFAYSPESTYINTVDLLIIFDPNVDTDGLARDDFIQRELDFANETFRRSGAFIKLNLVAVREQEIADNETLRTLIYPLGDNRDTFNWVTEEQQQVGADIAFLFLSRRADPIACGVAYLDGTREIGKTRGITQCYMNSVFQPDYLRYYNRAHETFTHEIGHILGLAHDVKNTTNNIGIFDHSYGYQQDGVELGTIMSYSNEAFNRFSDPYEREEVDGISYSIGNDTDSCFGIDCEPQPITNATAHLNRVRDTMSKLEQYHQSGLGDFNDSNTEFADDGMCYF